MKKKIAVNTRFLIENKLEGIGWFTFQTVKRLCEQHPEIEWHLLFDRAYPEDFIFADNVVPHIIAPKARHPILWHYWFEFAVPRKLKQIQPDLFFSTDGYLSLSTNIPSVVVIHDLAFEHFKDHTRKWDGKFLLKHSPKYAKKADAILTVSEYSKEDIIEKYQIPEERIHVVYNGASDIYQPISSTEQQEIRNKFTDGHPFFIYAGSVHPRKNVDRLLQAFDQLKKESPSTTKLVIAGRMAWKTGKTLDALNSMEFRDDVIFTGHLAQDDLSKLMASALCLCYVSLFEGFGIPIIEAMECEVPVITSNVSSMKEVGGDAALLVDPFSVDAIAAAMRSVQDNPDIREVLIQKANIHKKKFSWDKTAEKCWKVLNSLL